MWKIRLGLEHGLTPDEIALYADKKYRYEQMMQIRVGLENGLTPDQVTLYTDEKYNYKQMMRIRLGLEDINKHLNLTPEKKDFIAVFSQKEFYKIRKYGDHVSTCTSVFNNEQLEEIGKCVNQGIPYDTVIEKIAKPNISTEEMVEIKDAILEEIYKNPETCNKEEKVSINIEASEKEER